jgi:hypothetical protein
VLDEKRSDRPQTSEDVFSKQLRTSQAAYVTNLSYQGQLFGEFGVLNLIYERIMFKCVTAPITLFGTRRQAELYRNIGRHAPPDFTPLGFFTWGFIKCNVYKTKVSDVHEIRRRIYKAARALTPNMLRDDFRATVKRRKWCQVELYWICYTTATPITHLTFVNFGEVIL